MAIEIIRARLADAFPDADTVDVVDRTGGGDHFHVTVVSPSFAGLALIDQHRRVNDVLADLIANGTIHELRITTRGTP
jgi:stress-induced morphogen